MNQIIQPKCPYFQGEFVLLSNTCPTAEAIFEKWGMDFAKEQQPLARLTHKVYNYLESFFALIGLGDLFSTHVRLYANDVQRLIHLVVLDKEEVHSKRNLGQVFVISSLYHSTFFEKLDVLTALTQDLGVDVNYQDRGYANGDSPLHWAARNGKVAAINALLLAGADPYRKNIWGERPHTVAFKSNQIEAEQFLFKVAPLPQLPQMSKDLEALLQQIDKVFTSLQQLNGDLNAGRKPW